MPKLNLNSVDFDELDELPSFERIPDSPKMKNIDKDAPSKKKDKERT